MEKRPLNAHRFFLGEVILESMKWIVGIDEVGRGPLAGPVYVASVSARGDFYGSRGFNAMVKGIKDSKQLSLGQRDAWFGSIVDTSRKHPMIFRFCRTTPQVIDKIGIEGSVLGAVDRSLEASFLDSNTKILLDGRLKAPERFLDQKSIVKGDEKIPLISMASIVAKVKRDAYMKKQSVFFPQYGFETNVGYGTAEHCNAIRKHGLSPLHRKTFCTNFLGRVSR
jgi:ribonuclease HII